MSDKYIVTFKNELCIGCGKCISACPRGIIFKDENTFNILGCNPAYIEDQLNCIGCGSCALICPKNVITINRHK